MEKEEKSVWKKLLPTALKVAPRTIAMDLESYDPSNPKDVAKWQKRTSALFENIKRDFDKKGIPIPSVVIDTSLGSARLPTII
jgi:hypothetical protein